MNDRIDDAVSEVADAFLCEHESNFKQALQPKMKLDGESDLLNPAIQLILTFTTEDVICAINFNSHVRKAPLEVPLGSLNDF